MPSPAWIRGQDFIQVSQSSFLWANSLFTHTSVCSMAFYTFECVNRNSKDSWPNKCDSQMFDSVLKEFER
jgi:hypothetical protein